MSPAVALSVAAFDLKFAREDLRQLRADAPEAERLAIQRRVREAETAHAAASQAALIDSALRRVAA